MDRIKEDYTDVSKFLMGKKIKKRKGVKKIPADYKVNPLEF